MNRQHKKTPSLVLLITLVGFPQLSETIFTPSLPEIAAALGVSMSTTQLTMSIYFFAFAFGVFFWGWLSDRVGRRPAMLYGISIYGLGSFLCLVSPTMELLLLARFIQAFGASTGSVTTQTILRESFDGASRHILFAHISAALAFAPAIGPMIGGGLGQFWSFRAIFLFLVLLSLAIWVYAFVALPETYDISERQSANLWPIVKRLVGNVKVLTYGCLIGAINGVIFSYYAEAPFIFIETFDLSPLAFGLIGILVASASVIGAQMSKRLIGQIQAERIILWGIGAFIVGSGWQLLINRFLPNGSGLHLVCILSGIFVMLIGLGMALPNCLSLALVDFQDVIGSASALFSLGYYFLVSLFTYGMSFFHNGSLGAMPLYFLVIGSLMWWLTRKFLISSK